jgi:hypothetical protein
MSLLNYTRSVHVCEKYFQNLRVLDNVQCSLCCWTRNLSQTFNIMGTALQPRSPWLSYDFHTFACNIHILRELCVKLVARREILTAIREGNSLY